MTAAKMDDTISRDDEDPFVTLRELLAGVPSQELWAELCGCIRRLQQSLAADASQPGDDGDGSVLAMALDYASEHMASWEPTLRTISWQELREPYALLARILSLAYWQEGLGPLPSRDDFAFASPVWSRLEGLTFEGGINREVVAFLEAAPTSHQLAAVRVIGSLWNAYSDEFAPLLARLLNAPLFRGLTTLELYDCGLNADGLMALQVCENLGALKQLDVTNNFLDGEGVQTLANMPIFTSLEALDLSFNTVDDACLLALSQAFCLPRLREITMASEISPSHALSARGLLAVIYPSRLSQLQSLRISLYEGDDEDLLNDLADDAGQPQANRFTQRWLDSLCDGFGEACAPYPFVHLQIEGFAMSQKMLEALLRSPRLSGLKILDLSGSEIGNDGAAAIASCEALSQLEELHLNECQIGDSGLLSLSLSPHLGCLRRLGLRANQISATSSDMASEAVIAFSRSRRLPRLEEVSLFDNPLKEDGVLALAAMEGPALQTIYLGDVLSQDPYHQWLPTPPPHIEIASWAMSQGSRPPGQPREDA